MTTKTVVARLVFFTVSLLAAAELISRLSGIVDVPTYSVDDEIGYIPAPNQSGRFLNRNAWVFNDRSMGTGKNWDPTKRQNLLLIGNSIVIGGNPLDQKERLGTLIEKNLNGKYDVWPVAAGGWSNVNETVYLNRNPDVVSHANFFVWEYMDGG